MNIETTDNSAPAARTGPAKKIPCWICGGDLMLNFPIVAGAQITIRAYCPKCRRPRVLRMTLDNEPDTPIKEE